MRQWGFHTPSVQDLLFSLVVPAERGGLRSSEQSLKRLVERCGLRCRAALTTGMISQNNTPGFLVPWLKRFDRQIWWGEYTVLVAEKQALLALAPPDQAALDEAEDVVDHPRHHQDHGHRVEEGHGQEAGPVLIGSARMD